MSGKKVVFGQKPKTNEIDKTINDWVTGKKIENVEEDFKRTTINLPVDMHKKLKIMGATEGLNMKDIIIEAIKKHIKTY